MQSPLFRVKLKFVIHDRAHLINFSKFSIIYLFLMIFINVFKLYRNIYRAIISIYVMIIKFNWKKRKKRANVLFLTLNSYINNFFDVIKMFKFNLIILNKSVIVEINNVKYMLYMYIMIFIENIK